MNALKKLKKPLKATVEANIKNGYLDNKTIKTRQKFSESASQS